MRILTGEGGMGHIYSDAVCSDFEFEGMFRISDQDAKSNGGLYFRANPPVNNPDGFPRGYEAQICHNQDACTGWLWKHGKPTGKATELLTKMTNGLSIALKLLEIKSISGLTGNW